MALICAYADAPMMRCAHRRIDTLRCANACTASHAKQHYLSESQSARASFFFKNLATLNCIVFVAPSSQVKEQCDWPPSHTSQKERESSRNTAAEFNRCVQLAGTFVRCIFPFNTDMLQRTS
eukprot:6197536-Pleurochrysis_carterae.AAC.10